MRARSFTVLAAAGIAATALAWKPGGDYAGSGASTNPPAYDPFLGNILPWSANVQVVGRIATNDMAVFTDRSGRYVRGTNFIGMVEAAASNAAASAGYATTGQVAAAVALITANLQAEIAGSTGTLVRAESTNGWQVGAHQAWLTNETDAAALAFAATNRVRTWSDPDDAQSWWVDNDTNRVKYTRTVSGTNFVVTLSANFEETLTHTRPALTNNVYPFSEGQWTGLLLDSLNGLLSFDSGESTYARWENITVNQHPIFLLPVENAQGTATVSISSYNYITNVAAVYILTTGNVWQAISAAHGAADDAVLAADLAQGDINSHLGDSTPHAGLFAPASATNAPAWIGVTNYAAACTVTNALERPQFLYATGDVSVAFAGLRPPQPFYFVLRGPSSVAFPAGTHFVGGGSWQTNMSNHFVVWQYGTNLFVNPVTTSED